jgi:signal transduction histidine kinase
VEDNPADAAFVDELLLEAGDATFDVEAVPRMERALEALEAGTPDCILLDLSLPDARGLEGVRLLRARKTPAPIVVLTGRADDELAIRALREGASDYLVKDGLDADRLSRSIRYAVERRAIDRLKDEFISAVSHELRTPLASIKAAVLMIQDATEGLDPAVQRAADIAVRNAERLGGLVDDILDLGSISSGRFSVEPRPCRLEDIVDESIALLADRAEAAGVVIAREGVSATIVVDPDRILQVVTNLLANAVKFSEPGSVVGITTARDGDHVTIDVVDSGAGIPSDRLESVFEPFTQIDSSDTRAQGGVGLGLAICRSIVEMHGGTIRAERMPRAGTRLHVAIPADAAATGRIAMHAGSLGD